MNSDLARVSLNNGSDMSSDMSSDISSDVSSDMSSDTGSGQYLVRFGLGHGFGHGFGLGHGLGHGKFQNLGHGSDSDMSSDTRVRPTLAQKAKYKVFIIIRL